VFITLGRQEHVEVFQADRDDLLLMGRLPGWEDFYSAGFLFFGIGMTLFGAALFRTHLTSRALCTVGMVLGVLLAVGGYLRLVLGHNDVTDAFLRPFLFFMIWLFILGVLICRHKPNEVPSVDIISHARSALAD
jgi:hypothetical protein